MKKNSLYIIVLLLGLCHHSFGQYQVESIPKELLSRAVATYREDNMEIHMKSPTDVIIKGNKVLTIHNQSGDEYAPIVVFYDKSKQIKEIKGEILDQFGKQIKKFSLRDFDDQSASSGSNLFDDSRYKSYEPHINTYPYSISYSYEYKSSQNLALPSWNPNWHKDVSVEKSNYKIIVPKNSKLRINSQNFDGKPKVEDVDKWISYTWQAENLKAIRNEAYSPGRHITGIEVMVVPEEFQFYKKSGQFNDWKSYGLWMNENLLKGKRSLPEAKVVMAKNLVKDLEDPKAKAKALYEFMQKKTRYISIQVGIGGNEPFPAEMVDRLGYGDCKALVNYMQALLEAVDIPSYYTIVQAGNEKVDINPTFANLQDGNHIILCLPFANDTTWLECTNQDMPFGYLGDFTDDRLVLACTPEGGKVMRSKSYPYHESIQHRIGKFRMDKTGKLTGEMETTYSGWQFENHFANVKENRDKQIENLRRWYNINRIGFNQVEYKIEQNKKHQLNEKIGLTIDNYGLLNGNMLLLIPNIFNKTTAIPEIRNRQEVLKISRGYTDIDEIEIVMDDGVDTKIIPAEKIMENEIGSYKLTTKVEGKTIKTYRKIEIKEGIYPADKYEAFVNLNRFAKESDDIRYNLPLIDKK